MSVATAKHTSADRWVEPNPPEPPPRPVVIIEGQSDTIDRHAARAYEMLEREVPQGRGYAQKVLLEVMKIVVVVLLSALAACCPESSETDSTGPSRDTTSGTTGECGEELPDCPEAAGADLAGRCDEKFAGSEPCFWRPGLGGCGYPPPNALPASEITCHGEAAELWCCQPGN